MRSWLAELLEKKSWGEFEPQRQALLTWEYYPLFLNAVKGLKHEVLFVSHVHGIGHIERVMLHGAILAMKQGLNAEDVGIMMDACSYHDTGRIDDSADGEHGARSAQKLKELTDRQGEELAILKAMVTAHSRWDGDMAKIIHSYKVKDVTRARWLAKTLKDADGLDRVRLDDLDERYLRLRESVGQVGFAKWAVSESSRWHEHADRREGSAQDGHESPKGLAEAAEAFNAKGVCFPLKGGEGRAWCVGNCVLKLMGGGEQTNWVCETLNGLAQNEVRVPRYRRTSRGEWTHGGWVCCDWLDGEAVETGAADDWLSVMSAGVNFQKALVGVEKPRWLGKYYTVYTVADLVAWGKKTRWIAAFESLFETLELIAAGTEDEPCQLVHGDLSGNVLLHAELEPAVIDFSPYWRPFWMGPGTVVADALLWHGADERLVKAAIATFGRQLLPFVARGLMFRLAISNEVAKTRGLAQKQMAGEAAAFARAIGALKKVG